jgi:hypothetical protein
MLGPGPLIEGAIRAVYETMGSLVEDEDLDTALGYAYADDKTAAAVLLAQCAEGLCEVLFVRDHRIRQLETALQANGIQVPPEEDPDSIL